MHLSLFIHFNAILSISCHKTHKHSNLNTDGLIFSSRTVCRAGDWSKNVESESRDVDVERCSDFGSESVEWGERERGDRVGKRGEGRRLEREEEEEEEEMVLFLSFLSLPFVFNLSFSFSLPPFSFSFSLSFPLFSLSVSPLSSLLTFTSNSPLSSSVSLSFLPLLSLSISPLSSSPSPSTRSLSSPPSPLSFSLFKMTFSSFIIFFEYSASLGARTERSAWCAGIVTTWSPKRSMSSSKIWRERGREGERERERLWSEI